MGFTRKVVRLPVCDHAPPSLCDMRNFVTFCESVVGRGEALGKTVVLHDKNGVGRVGVLACALLLRRGLAQTPRQALLLYLRQRTILDDLDAQSGGLEACVRTFRAVDGAEEPIVTGAAARWMTPSMQRFVAYYARAQAAVFVSSAGEAVWALRAVRLVGVHRAAGTGRQGQRQEPEESGIYSPWIRVYSSGRLRCDSRRSSAARSGKAPSGCWEGVGDGVLIGFEPGECQGLRREVRIEVFDHEPGGDRLLCSVWQHLAFMPQGQEGATVPVMLERDQLDSPAAALLPASFRLELQWLRREGGGRVGGPGAGLGVGVAGRQAVGSNAALASLPLAGGTAEERLLQQGLEGRLPPRSEGRAPSGAYATLPSADASLDRLKASQGKTARTGSGAQTPPRPGSVPGAGERGASQGTGGEWRTGAQQLAAARARRQADGAGARARQSGGQESFRSELAATGNGVVSRGSKLKLPTREAPVEAGFGVSADLGHSLAPAPSSRRPLDQNPLQTPESKGTHAKPKPHTPPLAPHTPNPESRASNPNTQA